MKAKALNSLTILAVFTQLVGVIFSAATDSKGKDLI